ncbi:MAG TPA: energy transducer TonB [Bacteroidia bacterium]|jgi:TonB family protein
MKNKHFFILAIYLLFTISSFSQETSNVDVLPTNVGGKSEFKRVFEQELVYPESSLKNKVGGTVTINFEIRKDSAVSNVKMVSCGVSELDKEAMRIFKLYLWVPAIKEAEYIGTNWSVAFVFDPAKYSKICKARGYANFPYLTDVKMDTTGRIYKSGVQMPAYGKGNFALQDFIKENLEYPRQAQLSNIQGTVVLNFVVEPSGLMTNISVEKSIGGGCDQEAIRVLQLIKWYPGKHDESIARVKMNFPFYFVLNEDFKDNTAGEQK